MEREKKERKEEKGEGKLWYVTMIWCVVYSSFIIFNKFLNERTILIKDLLSHVWNIMQHCLILNLEIIITIIIIIIIIIIITIITKVIPMVVAVFGTVKMRIVENRKHQESIRASYCDRDPKDLCAGICMNPQEGV